MLSCGTIGKNISDPKKMFAKVNNFYGKAKHVTKSLVVDGA